MKTLLLILAASLNLFAAESGSVIVYNGVTDNALATNVLKVTGGTNATLTGSLSLHSLTATGEVTAASFRGAGNVSDSILALPDNDETHYFSIEAAGTTTTSVNMVGPAAPFTGLAKYTATGTNWVVTQAAAGTDFQGVITVKEEDGAPSVSPVTEIKVTNGTLTDNGSGSVSIVTGAGGAGGGVYSVTGGSASGNPADGATYYIGNAFSATLSNVQGRYRIPIRRAGTLTDYVVQIYGGVNGTTEDVTVDILLNGVTSVGSHVETWDAFPETNATTGLSQAVSVGDYIELRVVCPTWATNPTGLITYWQANIDL